MLTAKEERTQRAKTRELAAIAIFMVASIGAVRGFDIVPPLSERVKALLGPAPSQGMMGLALIVYSFSSIIRALAGMMEGTLKTGGFKHAAFLSTFYVFYYLSGLLNENFWAVFAAGVTIFALESYQIWSHREEEDDEEGSP